MEEGAEQDAMEIAGLRAELEQSFSEIDSLRDEVSYLTSQLADAKFEIEQAEQTAEEYKARLEATNEKLSLILSNYDEVVVKLTTLKGAHDRVVEERDLLKEKIIELKETTTKLEVLLEKTTTTSKDTGSQAIRDQLDLVTTQLRDAQQALRQREDEVGDLKDKIADEKVGIQVTSHTS